ncbi:hypothetical protein BDA99DRAFT_528064, partial [Phascolomyces articulosus]
MVLMNVVVFQDNLHYLVLHFLSQLHYVQRLLEYSLFYDYWVFHDLSHDQPMFLLLLGLILMIDLLWYWEGLKNVLQYRLVIMMILVILCCFLFHHLFVFFFLSLSL